LYYTSHTKAYNTIYTACNIVEAIYSFTQWQTNRKSLTRFRLVPKLSSLDDLERHWTANTHSVAEKMRLLEPTAKKNWMKIDPYFRLSAAKM